MNFFPCRLSINLKKSVLNCRVRLCKWQPISFNYSYRNDCMNMRQKWNENNENEIKYIVILQITRSNTYLWRSTVSHKQLKYSLMPVSFCCLAYSPSFDFKFNLLTVLLVSSGVLSWLMSSNVFDVACTKIIKVILE